MLKTQQPLQENEEYISYDVESLFTNVPVRETIDYIVHQICNENRLPKICSKLIFKRLLLKLTTESIFMFDDKFYKQTDGFTMARPLSVIFSNVFMTKMEEHVVPHSPPFYKRFVNKRRKDQSNKLLERMNNYHKNIKFMCEVSPNKFLDTEMSCENGLLITSVHRRATKLPVHWNSKIPKKYK